MKYDIGDYVIVNSKMLRKGRYTNTTRERYWYLAQYSKPKLGRVVGLCRKFEGLIKYGVYADEPAYLRVTGSKLFWLVRFGWLNKPVLCSDECLTLAKPNEIEDFPTIYQEQIKWSDEDKKYLSELSKNWPRDEKGRWTK